MTVVVEARPPVQAPPDVITPAVAAVLAAPRPALGADDRVHLPYELFVTNPTGSAMHLSKVETLDAGNGDAVLATLQGAALDGVVKPLVKQPNVDIGPAQVSRVFLDLVLSKNAHIPIALSHRITLTLTPGGPQPPLVTGRTGVTDEDPVIIGRPLKGGRWLVGGGCCFPPSYHRTATLPTAGAFHAPERYAIDFVQLNANNKLFNGPQGDLSSYAYVGAKILSVADGVVVGILDGQPEQTPPHFPENGTPATAGGNYLMIDIGNGHYAYYAHMQPGSLTVELGSQVKEGQVLGLLGNTGNSDGPHLHFQITDGPSPLSYEGLPYVFKSFGSEGTITSDIDTLLGGATAVITPALAGTHKKQMALQNQVVSF